MDRFGKNVQKKELCMLPIEGVKAILADLKKKRHAVPPIGERESVGGK